MSSAFARDVTARTSRLAADGRYPLPDSLLQAVFGLSSAWNHAAAITSGPVRMMTQKVFQHNLASICEVHHGILSTLLLFSITHYGK